MFRALKGRILGFLAECSAVGFVALAFSVNAIIGAAITLVYVYAICGLPYAYFVEKEEKV